MDWGHMLNVGLDVLLTLGMVGVMAIVYRKGRNSPRLRGRRQIDDE